MSPGDLRSRADSANALRAAEEREAPALHKKFDARV